MEKKAQLGTIPAITIGLVIVGILIGVLFIVYDNFRSIITSDYGYVATVTNETVTIDGAAYIAGGVALANTNNTVGCWTKFNLTRVMNNSDGHLIQPKNYTYDLYGLKLKNLTSAPRIMDVGGTVHTWNVSYTYTYGKEACAAFNDTYQAARVIPDWLVIIVVLMIVGILLALVFNVIPTGGGFGRGGGAGGVTAEI